MTHTNIKLNKVQYNAANQCFEALVSVHTGGTSKTYPCAFQGPITMSFEQAADGLKTQALRRSKRNIGFYSQARHKPQQRAGRARFDPRTWLAQLGFGKLTEAA